MDLFQFQERAASQIASRFATYSIDPLMVDRTTTVPFVQTLVSITGSGKTLILADALAQIRNQLPINPIALWISKGRVVVSQAYANLSSGKYAANIAGFTVKPLLETSPADIEDAMAPLLLVATSGKFSVEDEKGTDRKIFQSQLDLASDSLWNQLKARRTDDRLRRPLIVIYDEGHNLSDLQARRLLELAPDALIAASATSSLPDRLEYTISRLRADRQWVDGDFTTSVSSLDVVEAGLVKERIALGGYVTPMETAVDALLSDMTDAREAASKLPVPFVPKAIYVCTTNTVDGIPISEDVKRPYTERQARPILIWRHLVETAKIDPAKIVIYSQIKFTKDFPAPKSMNLLSGGDSDYATFIDGGFEHIIFNLSLQEGWDDPTCGFAYVDKEMASTRQITQVIGRVLRQPGAEHYSDPVLNTAHFYVRSDERGTFDSILGEIRKELVAEHPAVAITIKRQTTGRVLEKIQPNPSRTVPMIGINSATAKAPIDQIINNMIDFRSDVTNTVGQGSRMLVLQEIGVGVEANFEWVDVAHSNRVTARSVFRRELQRLYSGALRRAGGPINLVDIELPKFDALIELTSPAAENVRDVARKVVETYIAQSRFFRTSSIRPMLSDRCWSIRLRAKRSRARFTRAIRGSTASKRALPVLWTRRNALGCEITKAGDFTSRCSAWAERRRSGPIFSFGSTRPSSQSIPKATICCLRPARTKCSTWIHLVNRPGSPLG